jgi:O-antigen/teichoic acid export membrane protein
MSTVYDSISGLVRSAGIIFIGSILGKILALLGQILIIRHLSPELFGHIALTYTVASTAAGLSLLGVHEGVTKMISADTDEQRKKQVLMSGYSIATVGGLFVLSSLYLFRVQIASAVKNPRLVELLPYFLPFLILYPISRISIAALRSSKRSLVTVVSRDLGPRVGALLIFGVAVIVGWPLTGAIIYWISIPAFIVLLSARYIYTDYIIGRSVTKLPPGNLLRELWSFSWPLALSSSLFIIMGNFDIFMISYFMEARSVGLYRAIRPLRQITTFAVVSFSFIFLPLASEFFVENRIDELSHIYQVSTKWITALSLPPVLLVTAFSEDVIRVLFQSSYVPAASALTILIGGLFFRSLVGPDGDVLKSINETRTILYSAAAAVVVNIVLNIFLIPRYGIAGAAFATVCGYAVHNLVELAIIYHHLGVHPFTGDNIRSLFPTIGFVLVLRYIIGDVTLEIISLIGIGCLLAFVHVLSMILTRCFDEYDLFLIEKIENRIDRDLPIIKSIIERSI